MYSTTALQGGRQDFEIRWAKKKFPRRGFFPEIFLNFYIEILKYWGILSPEITFEGQSRAFKTYINYLQNFRGEAGQNIGGGHGPPGPPSNYLPAADKVDLKSENSLKEEKVA